MRWPTWKPDDIPDTLLKRELWIYAIRQHSAMLWAERDRTRMWVINGGDRIDPSLGDARSIRAASIGD